MVLKRLIFVMLLAILVVAPSVADAPLVFLLKWGSFGNGLDQFAGPTGITTDVAGNVYITDAGHELVKKFSSTGQFLSAFGGSGFGNGKFRDVGDVSVDVNGTMYVSDISNALIQVFSSDGTFLRQWPAIGSFNSALDPTGAFLVTAAGDSARVYLAQRQ